MSDVRQRPTTTSGGTGPRRKPPGLRDLEPINISTDVLEQVPEEEILVLPLRDVDWSDWGRPERIVETLERIDRTPRFQEVTSH